MAFTYHCTPISTELVGDRQLFQGHLEYKGKISAPELISRVADDTKIPESMLANAANGFVKAVILSAGEGKRVIWDNTFVAEPVIKGPFPTEDADFDRVRNKLEITAYALGAMRDALVNEIAVNSLAKVKIYVFGSQDAVTKEQNCVTGTNKLLIQGKFVTLDSAKADEGVYLVGEDAEYKATVSANDAQTIDCSFGADVPAGTYRLEVRGRNGHDVNRALAVAAINGFTVKA